MKIAYFSDNFYPEISGISDSIITTGEELRKMGHEVVYVAARYSKRDYKPVRKFDAAGKPIADPRDNLPVKRLPSLPVPNSPTGQSRFEVPLGFALPFIKKFKPDIIHTQSPHGLGLEAYYASKLFNIPLIGTEHTPVEEFAHYSPIAGNLFGRVWLWWESWYYNRCTFVTAPYQGLIDEMRSRGLVAPGHGQPNPVPFASNPSTKEEKDAAKRELKIDGPMLFCSGRLAPEKKVDEILRATAEVKKQFPNITLLITGHGSAEPSLQLLAKELGIGGNVRFLGFVNSDLLPTLYRAADAYLIMSTAETQSLSLMQAYSAGVPAIAAAARGLVDYTPATAGFLVKPGDVKDLSEKISTLLGDEALRTQMGKAGAEFVTSLSPQHIAQKWIEIYQSTLKRQ